MDNSNSPTSQPKTKETEFPDSPDQKNNTTTNVFLDHCSQNSPSNILNIFLSENPNTINEQEDLTLNTALHYAAMNNKEQIAHDLLTKYNADPNIPNKLGDTPLHYAAKNGNMNLIQLLIKRGANFDPLHSNGNLSPRSLAKAQNFTQIEKYFEKLISERAENPLLGELFSAISNSDINQISFLLMDSQSNNYALLNARNPVNNNKTCLEFAIELDKRDVAKFLIQRGANINTQDNQNQTILHKLAQYPEYNLEKIKFLLENGINQTLQDKEGDIPLFIALRKESTPKILQLFLQLKYAADGVSKILTIRNNEGKALIDYLQESENSKQLLQYYDTYQKMTTIADQIDQLDDTINTNINDNIRKIYAQSIARQSINVWQTLHEQKISLTKENFKEIDFVESQTQNISFIGHRSNICTIRYSPDGRKIASAGKDGLIKIWDAFSGRCLKTFQSGTSLIIYALIFTQDGKKLISTRGDGLVQIWEIGSEKCINTLKGHKNSVLCVDISPDQTQFVTGGSDKQIKIWDLKSGDCLKTHNHTSEIGSIQYTANGQSFIIASGHRENSFHQMAAQSGTIEKEYKGHTSNVLKIEFSPDFRRIVSCSNDHRIKVWDAQTAKCLLSINAAAEYKSQIKQSNKGGTIVLDVTFSSDGRAIVSGERMEKIRVWDSQTGRQLEAITQKGYVGCVCVSPLNGREIISSTGHPQFLAIESKGLCQNTKKPILENDDLIEGILKTDLTVGECLLYFIGNDLDRQAIAIINQASNELLEYENSQRTNALKLALTKGKGQMVRLLQSKLGNDMPMRGQTRQCCVEQDCNRSYGEHQEQIQGNYLFYLQYF